MKLLNIFLFLFLFTVSTVSQTYYFQTHIIEIENIETGKSSKDERYLIITLDDYQLKIESGMTWKFTGNIHYPYQDNKRIFYTFAYDKYGTYCKIILGTGDAVQWVIIVEYKDYIIYYYCNLRK